jgi:hypothetical protein
VSGRRVVKTRRIGFATTTNAPHELYSWGVCMMKITKKLQTIYLLAAAMVMTGAGCMSEKTSYVKAPETPNIVVQPNEEGARASTGGVDATVTPVLSTDLIIKAFPSTKQAVASEPVETKKPVPLPDGTRSEYVIVSRDYIVNSADGSKKSYGVSITDTRGIPALLAFIQSYSAYDTAEGYRKSIASDPDRTMWVTYAYGPNKEQDGAGNLLMNFRNRFLIQIEGGNGVSADDLTAFMSSFNLDALR